MVLERSGYLTHVPGLRLAPVQLKLDQKEALAVDRWSFVPRYHLIFTHARVRCTNHPLHRLPPGYYPYLGQMPGPREPNRGGGPDQGYGQGGYNSLNRGNQVAMGGNLSSHVHLQIIRVGGILIFR